MNLYLDDDLVSAHLIRLLRREAHDVQLPSEVGLSGEPDPVQLRQAIIASRVFMTRNHDHFKQLHDLLIAASGWHPGIVVIRMENDPTRDLTPRSILRALGNLSASGVPLPKGFHILNHWR